MLLTGIMPARSGRLDWTALSWGLILYVLVPTGLFAVGYTLVGPRIGAVPVLQASASKALKRDEPAKEPEATATIGKPGPQIDIVVEPVKGKSGRKPPRAETRENERPKQPAAKEKKPAETASNKVESTADPAASDPASGGGASESQPSEKPESGGGGTGGTDPGADD